MAIRETRSETSEVLYARKVLTDDSRRMWIDHRQPLEACNCAEVLIGANEVIDWSGLMKVKGDS
jgi:hypothetical protein